MLLLALKGAVIVVICPAAFNAPEVGTERSPRAQVPRPEGVPGNPWSEEAPPLRSLETPGPDPCTERDVQSWVSKGKQWWGPEHHLRCHTPRGGRADSSSAVGKQSTDFSLLLLHCTAQLLCFLTSELPFFLGTKRGIAGCST